MSSIGKGLAEFLHYHTLCSRRNVSPRTPPPQGLGRGRKDWYQNVVACVANGCYLARFECLGRGGFSLLHARKAVTLRFKRGGLLILIGVLVVVVWATQQLEQFMDQRKITLFGLVDGQLG